MGFWFRESEPPKSIIRLCRTRNFAMLLHFYASSRLTPSFRDEEEEIQSWPKKCVLGCVIPPPSVGANSRNLGQTLLAISVRRPRFRSLPPSLLSSAFCIGRLMKMFKKAPTNCKCCQRNMPTKYLQKNGRKLHTNCRFLGKTRKKRTLDWASIYDVRTGGSVTMRGQ